MVSSFGVELSKLTPHVEKVELEHVIKSGQSKSHLEDIIPDARMSGVFNGKSFLIAIEVEIHQKEKQRILAKAKNYLKSNFYDYVFYFFPDEKLLKNYSNIFQLGCGSEYNQKIFLFTAPLVFAGKNSLSQGMGLVNGQLKSLFELFGGEK